MLSLLKAVYAFSLSPLFLQAGATPFSHVSELQERYLPDHHGAVASESSICSNIGIVPSEARRQCGRRGKYPRHEQGDETDVGSLSALSSASESLDAIIVALVVEASCLSGLPMALTSSSTLGKTAPAAFFQDIYNNNTNASIYGGLASGVPGEVRGLAHLHQNCGKLAWKDVMQGAIKTARYGWPVTKDLVRYMASANASAQVPNFLVNEPTWAIDFCAERHSCRARRHHQRQRYADTLETISIKDQTPSMRGQSQKPPSRHSRQTTER